MVKQHKISQVLLLLATAFLIMNGIVPHHHHHEEVCFVSTHCMDEEADHHDHKGVEDHHHDDETDFCQLNGFYLASIVKQFKGQTKVLKFNKDLASYAVISESPLVLPFLADVWHKILLEDQKGLKAKYLTRALRAPPVS